MKTLKSISWLMLVFLINTVNAQNGQTQLKLEAGSMVTGKLTIEVEKHFPGRIAVFIRAAIIQPSLFESGMGQPHKMPAIAGIAWKAGLKYYLTHRLALRPEIGFSRVIKPNPETPHISSVEFTRGMAFSVSYTLPLKGNWFIEPFAGLGAFQISVLHKKNLAGFTNDYATEYFRLKDVRNYGTATHLSLNGKTGIVAGINIGYKFHTD